jgi:hypothetical protein
MLRSCRVDPCPPCRYNARPKSLARVLKLVTKRRKCQLLSIVEELPQVVVPLRRKQDRLGQRSGVSLGTRYSNASALHLGGQKALAVFPEIDTATALRRRASGLLVLVVLRCALDRRYPALAPLHPDLGFGLQLEGRLIQTSDPNLDERVAGVGCVKEPRPTAGAEAATVIA